MTIVDLPDSLLRAMSLTWTMDFNHARVESPFSGVGQTQRGQLERWRVAFKFHNVERRDAGEVEGFFMRLEGNANAFRFSDPSRPSSSGVVSGSPTLASAVVAGERILEITGLQSDAPNIFKAGDWIQIGHQLTKITSTVDSNGAGTATVSVWPKLWAAQSSGTAVIHERPKGIFRFLSQSPEWEVMAGAKRAWSFSLSGVQEVIADGHSLLSE